MDWQEDWSPETGQTAICPKCGSDDVDSLVENPQSPVLPNFYWFCNDCEFEDHT
jgi:hypothetical protein